MYFLFYLISLSLIGYGLFLSKILKINYSNFGILGLIGITFLCFFSYSSSIFVKHGFFINTVFLIVGIVLFLFFFKKIKNFNKKIISFFIVFSILLIFISVGKNHDDFGYYHFPYIALISEFSHPIGIGQLNNGFRSPSSLFFIGSMFYLPKIEYYLFHITPALILGFANLILLEKILSKKEFNNNNLSTYLSLFSFIFINIFFYRLAEHGTDRSGMILIILAIIFLIDLINTQEKSKIVENENIIKFFSLLICFVVSIKPFYLINLPLFLIVIYYPYSRNIFKRLLFSRTFFYCLSFILFTIFYTFINSSCLFFPLKITCIESVSWSLDKEIINDTKIWFELWSKGGANPSFVVDDRTTYISGFNWFSNWIDIYFFNKVSDYILGLCFLVLVVCLFFYNKTSVNKVLKKEYLLVYIFLILTFFEWFYNHPSLRYGGYHIIALIIFIPFSLLLCRFKIDYNFFIKRAMILIIITFTIFISRNIMRLDKEYNQYSYNIFDNTNFLFISANKEIYFRYNIHMKENMKKYKKINFLGKKIINTTYQK